MKENGNEIAMPNTISVKVRKAHPSSSTLEVTVPREYCVRLGIEEGDEMKLLITDDILAMAPIKNPEAMKRLKELLAGEVKE